MMIKVLFFIFIFLGKKEFLLFEALHNLVVIFLSTEVEVLFFLFLFFKDFVVNKREKLKDV